MLLILAMIIFLFSHVSLPPAEEYNQIEKIILTFNKNLSSENVECLTRIITEESERYNFSPLLIAAIIATESSFRIRAISSKGCIGLMQIRPATGEGAAKQMGIEWYGPSTLYDPQKNVRIGVFYLRKMLDRFGDLKTALTAYNSGPTITAKRLKSKIALAERYPDRVMGYYKKFSLAEF